MGLLLFCALVNAQTLSGVVVTQNNNPLEETANRQFIKQFLKFSITFTDDDSKTG